MATPTERERIERLERVLGTLICWLGTELGKANAEELLKMLKEGKTDE